MTQVPLEGQGRLLVPMATPDVCCTHTDSSGVAGKGRGEALKGSEGSLCWLVVSACTHVGVGERHCVYSLHGCIRVYEHLCVCAYVYSCVYSHVSFHLGFLAPSCICLCTGREPHAYLCLLCFLHARLPTACVE